MSTIYRFFRVLFSNHQWNISLMELTDKTKMSNNKCYDIYIIKTVTKAFKLFAVYWSIQTTESQKVVADIEMKRQQKKQ